VIQNFSDFKLSQEILNALTDLNYVKPTPIQQKAIPIVLEGLDLLGIAQTGTGKTASFLLPILQRLKNKNIKANPTKPLVLILTPTRELAVQINQNVKDYSKNLKLRSTMIFGGVGQGNQVRDLRSGVEILVATPGRLLDLISQKHLHLDQVEVFVLDEADRMLDMGFFPDIKRTLTYLPKKRHNLFFSATMPSEIKKLADQILQAPKVVEITPESTTVEKIKQSVMFVDKKNKVDLLLRLLQDNNLYKVLVFTEMKHMASRISDKLIKNNISSSAIHGNKSQGARQRAIQDFSEDKIRVLVATDIASRGIDIDGITHVINYDLPKVPEQYVHRIGRTARAGASGESISFCSPEEKYELFAIEKSTRQKLFVDRDQPFHTDKIEKAPVITANAKSKQHENQRRSFKKKGISSWKKFGPKKFGKKK